MRVVGRRDPLKAWHCHFDNVRPSAQTGRTSRPGITGAKPPVTLLTLYRSIVNTVRPRPIKFMLL